VILIYPPQLRQNDIDITSKDHAKLEQKRSRQLIENKES
jgi:hypothetical protein